MTAEEAIKVLMKILENPPYDPPFGFDDAIYEATDALEKQIKQKPIITTAPYYCPNCGEFCGCIGLVRQKRMWKKEEEK